MEPIWGKLASYDSKQTALRHKMASRRAHESQDEPSWSQNWPCRVLGEQKGCKKVVKRMLKGCKKGAKRCLGRGKLRPGGSMNLEFDFEFRIPHATHKALGLGRRIFYRLRLMPPTIYRPYIWPYMANSIFCFCHILSIYFLIFSLV